MKKRVGLIGFGKIGRYIYKDLAKDVDFVFVYDLVRPNDENASKVWISTPEELAIKCKENIDLVVEAAVSKIVISMAPIILKYTDFLALSTTAFAETGFEECVQKLCNQYGHVFYVPHGAILGLDGIHDCKSLLKSVTITTTKRPENLGVSTLERKVLYEGPTREACKAFPRNVNVHAGTAVAGLGLDKTKSIIVADPKSFGNHHRIEIDAEGCKVSIDVLGKAGSGVTSSQVPVSAAASVRKVLFKQGIVVV